MLNFDTCEPFQGVDEYLVLEEAFLGCILSFRADAAGVQVTVLARASTTELVRT